MTALTHAFVLFLGTVTGVVFSVIPAENAVINHTAKVCIRVAADNSTIPCAEAFEMGDFWVQEFIDV